ncbi:hypothetical protein [Clostridium sp. BL8]|uniref:hypothetical protein n=1 Tax=Clostridium sp. BL8 TaxID=1354301 RepID=UPI0003FCCD5B|nr:hypothetical protein [Clostridium sp. BL8]
MAFMIGSAHLKSMSVTKRGKTYTFSCYVKTKDIPVKDNSGAALTLGYQDASGQWKYVREFIKGTTDWNRYETTLTVPNDISNDYIWVAAELVETTGTAYFDSLQLEEGQFANRYNLIENSDFTLWDKTTWKPIYWKSNNAIDSTDYVDYSYSNNHPKAMNTLSMKINGNARAGKGIYQDVNIAGKKGDVYVLGGWAKANAAPLVEWRLFQMDLGFVKYDGSIFWKKLSFNDDVWDWQYAASEIVAPEDYKGIQVYISYYQNLGNAYFDGIQLYKEEFGTSYQYDSKGNVISTADLAKQNSKFQYDGNNDLTTSIDPKGSSFTYEYDNGNTSVKKHNLTKATSAENVVYSFDYDNFGNAKWSKVGSDALFIKSDASYTPSGNYIKDVVDPRGNKVTFDYDEANGNLKSVTDPEGKVTSYSYNPKTNNLESVKKAVNGTDITNSYDYENDKIKKINHNGFGYEFQYDNFGNNTVVKVKGKDPAGQEATQNLITNTYEERNGNFKEATYGNGHKVSNIYDAMDRVIGKKFGTELRVKYQYNANNNLALKEDLVNKKNYRYNYDLADRLSTIKEIDPATSKIINETRYNYDLNNNVSEVNENINNYNYNIAYGYNKDNKPTSVTHKRGTLGQQLSSIYNISYGYDILGRLENKKIAIGTTNFQTNYKYYEGKEANSTTNLIKTIENGGKAISYEYDSKGNISKILEGDKVIQQYYYNEVNELIREDNKDFRKNHSL